ncbi:hypothetical protein [Streptomyces sp. NPDC057052]|uniref:hypothetical protein n=1 Tax=Streptomyces sp. NPDC057052 TaxID=3346010 RepID=UPI003630F47A
MATLNCSIRIVLFSQRGVSHSMRRPDPAQHDGLEGIRYDLLARIAEAECQGWLGEVKGLAKPRPSSPPGEECPVITSGQSPAPLW